MLPKDDKDHDSISKEIGLDVEATVDAENLKKESVVNHTKKVYFCNFSKEFQSTHT